MKKLSSNLQFAHAAEIAAYYAYDGHRRSVSNFDEQLDIFIIQCEENLHILAIERMLTQLKSEPSKTKDRIGKFVGTCIGLSCFIFGWKLPMMIAGLMEKIGTASYRDLAEQAQKAGHIEMSLQLLDMAKNEEEHEKYFTEIRKKK